MDISYKHEGAGEIRRVLPHKVSSAFDMLPDDLREAVQRQLTHQIAGFTHTLLACIQSPDPIAAQLDLTKGLLTLTESLKQKHAPQTPGGKTQH